MGKIRGYMQQFHPIVWILLTGTILIRGAAFMTLPFLSIYLSRDLNLHPVLIGLTVGISPLMATVGGFIGGQLSDRFGRKPIILFSLFTISAVYYGFTWADEAVWFIVLNAGLGLCNAFFEPTSQALIADLTDKEKRMKAYSLRYTAINIGASVGPLAGAYMASVSAGLAFIVTGTVYLIYALALLYYLSKYPVAGSSQQKNKITLGAAFTIVRKDKALGYLILGGLLVNAGYSQVHSNLAQHLDGSIEKAVFLFSVLLSINAIMVVFLSIPISHWTEKFQPMQVMIAGAIFTAAGLAGFGLAGGWTVAILGMALLTIGEILIFPSNSLLIDRLASEELRGTYFGASQFRKLGNFIGPIFGGYLLSSFGGGMMFWIFSAIVLASIFFFGIGNSVYVKISMPAVKNETG